MPAAMEPLLFLVHRIPFPPNKGDKVRSFHLLEFLASRYRVHLGTFVDSPDDLVHVARLREYCASSKVAEIRPALARARSVVGLWTGEPLTLRYYRDRTLRRWVREVIGEQRIAKAVVFSSAMAPYVSGLPDLRVVVDFVDVDSDKWRQYADHTRPPLSWLYRVEGRRLQAAEADIARWARVCLLATQAEESLLQSFAPWARSAVIPNGIDLAYYEPVAAPAAQPVVMFTGAMDYLPNIDAVCHFCADILPRVRREIPETRFYIVGLNPSPDVLRLASMPGVTVTGRVPDVRPYYARAAVCVAPLRIGRGIQNKVLQGMAMGLPLVASPLAARGLEAQPGRHLEVADDAAEFATRLVRLLKSPADRRALGRNGRAFVEANYGWERSLFNLERLLEEAAGPGGAGERRARSVSSLAGPSVTRPEISPS